MMTDNTNETLTDYDKQLLEKQNIPLVSEFAANMLEKKAQKYWDLFYKRNGNRFFKDRNWTTREFEELLNENSVKEKTLLEIGCGVGNFIFPLIKEKKNFFICACDFSTKAINLLKSNPLYDSNKMYAFQTDITTQQIFNCIEKNAVDIITLIFVLSAIHPDKFNTVMLTIRELLKPNGVVLFRDYGVYDMAQIRFKPGQKISENFYMRRDYTRSYFFSVEEVTRLFEDNGFDIIYNNYVHRKTVNFKEGIDVPRKFIQGKFQKRL